jgi:hypothetical protein
MEIIIKHIGGKYFKIDKRIYHTLSNEEHIVIPVGFPTDLATAPVILWGFFPPYSDFLPAAIVHDWLYKEKYVGRGLKEGYQSRLFADREMLKISMVYNNAKGLRGVKRRFGNRLRFLAVRCLGWIYWNNVIK